MVKVAKPMATIAIDPQIKSGQTRNDADALKQQKQDILDASGGRPEQKQKQKQTDEVLASPAFPGAKHDKGGFCTMHPRVRMCTPVYDTGGESGTGEKGGTGEVSRDILVTGRQMSLSSTCLESERTSQVEDGSKDLSPLWRAVVSEEAPEGLVAAPFDEKAVE